MIFLISASQVTRITGVSHWHLATVQVNLSEVKNMGLKVISTNVKAESILKMGSTFSDSLRNQEVPTVWS
jgi:hypothetical protein